MSQAQWGVRMLEKALSGFGVASEPGQAILKALTQLSKHIAPGGGSPGVEQNALSSMMMQARQNQPNLQLLRTLGQPKPGGAPGAPAPGGPPVGAAA
jgi:hypothetical protein